MPGPVTPLSFDRVGAVIGGRAILVELSLEIVAGRTLGVVGPNGVGKTTLLRLAAGVLRPTHGRIVCPASAAPRIGLLLQADIFPQNETVRRFMRFFARLSPSLSNREEEEVESVLERVGLAGRADARLRELSYGESRLAMLGRALIGTPELLLLDEPTLGLDESNLQRCLSLLQELKGGPAIVLVSNEIRHVEMVCDRILILEGPGSASTLDLSEEDAWVTRIVVRDARDGVVEALQALAGVRPVTWMPGGRAALSLPGRPQRNTTAILNIFRTVEDWGGTIEAYDSGAAIESELVSRTGRSGELPTSGDQHLGQPSVRRAADH